MNFISIACIHGIAKRLERHHEGITLGIVHIDMPLIFRVAQDIKALLLHLGRVYVVMVIDNADAAPEIRYRIGIVGVIGEILHLRGQVIQIGNQVFIQFLQGIICKHTLNHIIRGNDNVIGIPCLQLRIHHLVGIEKFHNYLYPIFLFKVWNQLLAHVFPGDIQL